MSFDKLALLSGRYEWGTYWKPGVTQIDLVVAGEDDREVRIIEAKWTSRRIDAASDLPDQLLDKRYEGERRKTWRQSRHIALSSGYTPGFAKRARDQGIGIIELADLF